MDFDKIFPKDLYHSYVIEGNPEILPDILRGFLESKGEIDVNSSDLLINLYDSFAISDCDFIKEWHKSMPISGKKKICIIGTKFINREAEQSLLKIIEEPNLHTHFFIVVPDSSLLLSTILSRVHLIKNIVIENELDQSVTDFLKCDVKSRMNIVENLIKEFKDNDNSGGLRNKAISLVNGIEKEVYKKWKEDLNNENLKFMLNELKNCRMYLSTPGASVKMILEHLALII